MKSIETVRPASLTDYVQHRNSCLSFMCTCGHMDIVHTTQIGQCEMYEDYCTCAAFVAQPCTCGLVAALADYVVLLQQRLEVRVKELESLVKTVMEK